MKAQNVWKRVYSRARHGEARRVALFNHAKKLGASNIDSMNMASAAKELLISNRPHWFN